jgi:hypothetical protein
MADQKPNPGGSDAENEKKPGDADRFTDAAQAVVEKELSDGEATPAAEPDQKDEPGA